MNNGMGVKMLVKFIKHSGYEECTVFIKEWNQMKPKLKLLIWKRNLRLIHKLNIFNFFSWSFSSNNYFEVLFSLFLMEVYAEHNYVV